MDYRLLIIVIKYIILSIEPKLNKITNVAGHRQYNKSRFPYNHGSL